MLTFVGTHKAARARFYAVIALLCVLGGQSLEAAHYHALDEPVSSCLQCHNTAGSVAHTNIISAGTITAAILLLFFLRWQAKNTPTAKGCTPRGPPRKSC